MTRKLNVAAVQMDANPIPTTERLARAELAQVTLPDQKRVPQESQPASLMPKIVYFMSDVWLTSLAQPTYRRGLRRILT